MNTLIALRQPRAATRPFPLAGFRPPTRFGGAGLRALAASLLCAAAPLPAGAGWEIQPSGTDASLRAITASHGNHNRAFACGDGGVILRTTDGGLHWTQQESGTTEDLHDIVALELGGEPLLAAGANGTILASSDSGATWVPRASGTGATLRALADFGFWAVGDSGTVLGSTDNGLTWTPRPADTTARLRSISALFTKYIVGDGGTVLRTSNQGQSWYASSSGWDEDLHGTPMFGSVDLAVGDGGLILKSTDFGQSWMQLPSGTLARLEEVEYSVNNTTRAFCVGAGGIILRTSDSGVTWGQQVSGTSVDLHSVFFYLSDLNGWAAGDDGVILRTTDGGGPVIPAEAPEVSGPEAAGSSIPIMGRPNPFRGTTTIEVHPGAGPALLEIFEPGGRRIRSWRLEGGAAAHTIVVDLEGAGAGVFLTRVSSREGVGRAKLVHVP